MNEVKMDYQLMIRMFLSDVNKAKAGWQYDQTRKDLMYDFLMQEYTSNYTEDWKIKAKEKYPEEFL